MCGLSSQTIQQPCGKLLPFTCANFTNQHEVKWSGHLAHNILYLMNAGKLRTRHFAACYAC